MALVAAGIDAYEEEEQVERPALLETAHGGRPQARHEVGRAIDLKLRGVGHRVDGRPVGPHRFRVGVGAAGSVRPSTPTGWSGWTPTPAQLVIADQRFRLLTATHGPIHLVEVDGVTHRVTRDEGGVLRSPAPALVVATPVELGDEVEAGAPVLVLESMKMETVLRAPFAAGCASCSSPPAARSTPVRRCCAWTARRATSRPRRPRRLRRSTCRREHRDGRRRRGAVRGWTPSQR